MELLRLFVADTATFAVVTGGSLPAFATINELNPAPRQAAGHGGLRRLDVARAARRPGLLVRGLRRMSGEVSATSGYSRPAGEGEGDDGEIALNSRRGIIRKMVTNTEDMFTRR